MSRLDFPLLPDGLLVDALVGVDGDTTAAAVLAGQPVPAPILTRGAIDTGADLTGVSAAILRRLGVPLQYQTTTHTAGGLLAANVYKVSVGVRDLRNPTSPEFLEPTLLVMELASTLPVVEVLIGLNFLLGYKLFVDGPGRHFSVKS
jgi:hypothetical protein